MLSVVFQPAAEVELQEICDYYDACQPRLGDRFERAVFDQLDVVARFPNAFPERFERWRRVRPRPFPYLLFYEVETDRIVVAAIVHASRDPDAIRQRLRQLVAARHRVTPSPPLSTPRHRMTRPATNDPLDPRGLPAGYELHPTLETTPRETKRLLDATLQGDDADFVLIDCRLPQEAAITKIDGGELIPLQQVHQHADRLKAWRDKKVVVYCRSGGRSLQFAQLLKHNGFNDVRSMAGGILLWNRDINPGGPQY